MVSQKNFMHGKDFLVSSFVLLINRRLTDRNGISESDEEITVSDFPRVAR